MIRVCHLVRQYHPNVGGLENFVAGLSRALVPHDCRSTVITLDRLFVAPHDKLPALERVDGIEVRRVAFVGHRRLFVPMLATPALAEFDVIHVHGLDGLFEAVARTPARIGQVRIATSHGLFFHTRWMQTAKRLYLATIIRLAATRYNALIANSASDASFMRQLGRPLECIPNGVDALGCCASGRDLLALGRLASHKHVERLIDALADARLSAVRLHIVGGEWDVARPALEAHAQARGVRDRVILHGHLDASALHSVVAQCGVYVSASAYEGFGMSLIEAMSAGLIPVVHPNPSFAELMTSSPVGTAVPFDNPPRAAAAIAQQLQMLSPARQQQAIAFARRYSWTEHGARTAALYQRLLEQKRGAHAQVV